MAACIFCEIAESQAPSSKVYEDELSLAFLDIQPVNPGHVLVIPKSHATDLFDLDPETGAHLFQVAQKIARALTASGLKCEGVDLLLAHGEAAGQEVFHVHLHVIPRFRGDGFGFRFGPGYEKLPPRHELDSVAAQLGLHVKS